MKLEEYAGEKGLDPGKVGEVLLTALYGGAIPRLDSAASTSWAAELELVILGSDGRAAVIEKLSILESNPTQSTIYNEAIKDPSPEGGTLEQQKEDFIDIMRRELGEIICWVKNS